MTIEATNNHMYSVLRQQVFDIAVEDFALAVAPSVDSIVATAQASTPLPFTDKIDVTLYPLGAVSAYIYLNTVAMSTRQPSADVITTAIRVDYLDLLGGTHPLFVFDSRLFSLPNVLIQRMIAVPINQPIPGNVRQPGIVGNLLFTVVQTSAVAAHPITYDVFVSGQFVYVVPDKPIDELVEGLLQKHKKGLLSDIEGMLKNIIVPIEVAGAVGV